MASRPCSARSALSRIRSAACRATPVGGLRCPRFDRHGDRTRAPAEPAAIGHDKFNPVLRRADYLPDISDRRHAVVENWQANEIADAYGLRKAPVHALSHRHGMVCIRRAGRRHHGLRDGERWRRAPRVRFSLRDRRTYNRNACCQRQEALCGHRDFSRSKGPRKFVNRVELPGAYLGRNLRQQRTVTGKLLRFHRR